MTQPPNSAHPNTSPINSELEIFKHKTLRAAQYHKDNYDVSDTTNYYPPIGYYFCISFGVKGIAINTLKTH